MTNPPPEPHRPHIENHSYEDMLQERDSLIDRIRDAEEIIEESSDVEWILSACRISQNACPTKHATTAKRASAGEKPCSLSSAGLSAYGFKRRSPSRLARRRLSPSAQARKKRDLAKPGHGQNAPRTVFAA